MKFHKFHHTSINDFVIKESGHKFHWERKN